MAKMTRVALNRRKRQRPSDRNEKGSASNNNIFNNTNCFRMLCLFALSQVALSAYHNYPKVHSQSTTTAAVQFAASGGIHATPREDASSSNSHSALQVSLAEPSDSASSSTTPSHDARRILPEWEELSESVQQELRGMLSYQKVSTYDYPEMFRLDELTNGHSLLFMSWAILASPYSQPVLSGDNNDESEPYLNVLKELKLSPTKFCNLVRTIENGYPMNPYHNRIHATDVFQTLHSLLVAKDSIQSQLTFVQYFSLLLAAILHDVGHDGTNNLWHVQKQSPLAVQYQNVSVLEQHHVQVGLDALEASGLLSDLAADQQAEIPKLVRDAILHTDMAKHHAQVQAYQSGHLTVWEQAMYWMHLCDISNPIKSSQLVWGDLVLEEFFRIGDAQKSMGLTPTFDRNASNKVSLQQGFLQFMVLPAFEVVTFSNPKIMEGLYENLEYWMNQEPVSSGEKAKEPPI